MNDPNTNPPVIRRTSAAITSVDFLRKPTDATEPQTERRVVCLGSLAHETWTRTPEGPKRDTVREGVRLVAEFYGDAVQSPDDVARSLRALADAIEWALTNPEDTTAPG